MSSFPVKARRRRRRVIAEDKITILGMDELVMRIESGDRWLDRVFDSGWVRDQDLDCCMVCASDFHVIRRRHHCRVCGNLVCADCTTYGRLVVNNRDECEILCCVQCCYGQVIYVTEEVGDSLESMQEMSGARDSGVALVHTTMNASERLLSFTLFCNRDISCDVLLTKHCSWDDICAAVVSAMGLPIKEVTSFLVLDEDGEVDSPVIGSSINFWHYVLQHRTFFGRCLLVNLSKSSTKKVQKYITSHRSGAENSDQRGDEDSVDEGSIAMKTMRPAHTVSFEAVPEEIPRHEGS